MAKVFVPKWSWKRDFTDALRFGELVKVTETEIYSDLVDTRMAGVIAQVNAAMDSFDPDNDYLLLTGDPIAIAACFLRLGRRRDVHRVRMLKWDYDGRAYFVVPINLKETVHGV